MFPFAGVPVFSEIAYDLLFCVSSVILEEIDEGYWLLRRGVCKPDPPFELAGLPKVLPLKLCLSSSSGSSRYLSSSRDN